MLSLEIMIKVKGDLLDSILQDRILSLQEADRWLKSYINDQFKTTDQGKVHRDVDKNTVSGGYRLSERRKEVSRQLL